jgi:hypothetical protein
MLDQETLDQLVRDEKARLLREWRSNNPDKVRAANKRYWEKRVLRLKSVETEGECNDE